LGREDLDRAVAEERGVVEVEADAERLGELAGAVAELLEVVDAAALAHEVDAVDGLESADEHGRPHALPLRHRVEQRVDAVRAVHVRPARRAKQHARAAGEADEGMAGGLLLVIALHLHDPAGRGAVAHGAADQIARDLVDGAVVEVARHET
jgi:hypothetical protein